MIDIKAEAEKVAKGYRLFSQPRSDLVADIIDLCTRYADEAREEAAKVAEKHKTWKFKQGGEDPHYTSCEGCGENIAIAIRATKEEKG